MQHFYECFQIDSHTCWLKVNSETKLTVTRKTSTPRRKSTTH